MKLLLPILLILFSCSRPKYYSCPKRPEGITDINMRAEYVPPVILLNGNPCDDSCFARIKAGNVKWIKIQKPNTINIKTKRR